MSKHSNEGTPLTEHVQSLHWACADTNEGNIVIETELRLTNLTETGKLRRFTHFLKTLKTTQNILTFDKWSIKTFRDATFVYNNRLVMYGKTHATCKGTLKVDSHDGL